MLVVLNYVCIYYLNSSLHSLVLFLFTFPKELYDDAFDEDFLLKEDDCFLTFLFLSFDFESYF